MGVGSAMASGTHAGRSFGAENFSATGERGGEADECRRTRVEIRGEIARESESICVQTEVAAQSESQASLAYNQKACREAQKEQNFQNDSKIGSSEIR